MARFIAGLDARTNDIVADGIRGGWFESREAHSVDALIDLVLPDSASAAGPDTTLHVVVDYEALIEAIPSQGRRVRSLEWDRSR